MFKRKHSTPERLVGRELLRTYGFVKPEECEYNVAFGMDNPDCINYGFAIGDFNEDGTPDIAAARSDATNTLYFGNIKSKKSKMK